MPSQPTRALQVRPTDPLVRWIVTGEEPPDLVAQDDAVAWMGRASRPGENWVTALGDDPAVVVALVERLESRNRVDGITVPESAFSHLPERLRSPDPGHWCLWTLDPADAVLSDTTATGRSAHRPATGALRLGAHLPGEPAPGALVGGAGR